MEPSRVEPIMGLPASCGHILNKGGVEENGSGKHSSLLRHATITAVKRYILQFPDELYLY
jgi:hypothetical protein